MSSAKDAQDDPEARRIFRSASENRYIWDGGFPGIKGELEIVDHGKPPIKASVTVDRNLSVDFECDKCDPDLRALARAQICQYVTHRAVEPFDEKYGVGKAYLVHTVKRRDDGTVTVVQAETRLLAGRWLASHLHGAGHDTLLGAERHGLLLDELLTSTDRPRQGLRELSAFRPTLPSSHRSNTAGLFIERDCTGSMLLASR